jgi:flavin-dependent dehydrogenase
MDRPLDFMPQAQYDFIVIGGGPGGSTAATILADAGKSVLVLEAAKFPRFAVGEIVAPTALWRPWHKLGITEEMLDAKFVRKWAGGWQAPDGTIFRFDQDVHQDDCRCRAFVYNIERAVYDDWLLDHARNHGVEALEQAIVEELLVDSTGRLNGVQFRRGDKVHEVRCTFLIDASGRANVIGRKLGLRMELEELKSFSVFAHYVGARRDEGQKEGEIRIIFSKDMWHWWAPLKGDKASIGVVANRATPFWDEYKADPEAYFDKYVQASPFVWDRIKDARRITGFKQVKVGTGQAALEGYHYKSTQLVGDGFALVGDAGGFIDPIFSAGLFVAQTTAMWLAEELLKAQAEGDLSRQRLAVYEERYAAEIGEVMKFVQRYSTDYFNPDFVNFYLGLGANNPRVRQLYIGTFIAYDPKAIAEYKKLADRLLKRAAAAGPPAMPVAEVAKTAMLDPG